MRCRHPTSSSSPCPSSCSSSPPQLCSCPCSRRRSASHRLPFLCLFLSLTISLLILLPTALCETASETTTITDSSTNPNPGLTVYAQWVPISVDESQVSLEAVCDHNMAALTNHSFVVFFGYNDNNEVGTNAHMYHLDVNKQPLAWSYYMPPEQPMPPTRSAAAVASLVNPSTTHLELYLSGGQNGDLVNKLGDFWRFDTVDKQWTQLPDLPHTLAWHTSLAVASDSVMVLQGEDGNMCLNETFIFSLSSHQWVPFDTNDNQYRPVRGEGTPCLLSPPLKDLPTSDDFPPELANQNARMFCFGGFKGEGTCYQDHAVAGSGSECYSSTVYILDMATRTWLPPVEPTGDDNPPRSFSSIALHGANIWLFGGAYLDAGATWQYYDNVMVFNTEISDWVPVVVKGTGPSPRWSHTGVVLRPTADQSEIWFFGGCSTSFFKDVYALKLDMRISAQQCRPIIPDHCVAGQSCNFTVAVYPSLAADSPVDFLTSLSFAFTVVQTLPSGQILPILGTCVENTERPGHYTASFTPIYGSLINVLVSLDLESIFHSPFSIRLEPAAVLADTATVSYSYGIIDRCVSGAWSDVALHLTDVYGNRVNASKAALSSNIELFYSDQNCTITASLEPSNSSLYSCSSTTTNLLSLSASNLPPSTLQKLTRLQFQASALASQSYQDIAILRYLAPSTPGPIWLHILLDGQEVVGSPVSVQVVDQWALGTLTLIASCAMAVIGCVVSVAVIVLFVRQRSNTLVKSSSLCMLCTCALGGFILSVSVFLLVCSHVREHSFLLAICVVEPLIFGCGFQMLVASLISKQWRIGKIFKQGRGGMDVVKLPNSHLIAIVGVFCSIDALFVLVPVIINPPSIGQQNIDGLLSAPQCVQDNSSSWSVVIWGFRGLVLIYGASVAVSTSGISDQYSDATVTGIAVYNLGVWYIFDLIVLAGITNIGTGIMITSAIRVYDTCSTLLLLSAPKLCSVWSASARNFFSRRPSGVSVRVSPATDKDTDRERTGGGGGEERRGPGSRQGSVSIVGSPLARGSLAGRRSTCTTPHGTSVPSNWFGKDAAPTGATSGGTNNMNNGQPIIVSVPSPVFAPGTPISPSSAKYVTPPSPSLSPDRRHSRTKSSPDPASSNMAGNMAGNMALLRNWRQTSGPGQRGSLCVNIQGDADRERESGPLQDRDHRDSVLVRGSLRTITLTLADAQKQKQTQGQGGGQTQAATQTQTQTQTQTHVRSESTQTEVIERGLDAHTQTEETRLGGIA